MRPNGKLTFHLRGPLQEAHHHGRLATLPRVVSGIAVIIALTVALAGPLDYFALRYERLTAEMLTELDIKAQDTSQLIAATGDMWAYEKYRLNELLRRRHELTDQSTRIFDNRGDLVVGLGAVPAAPVVCRSEALYDSGVVTGDVKVCRSLREVLWKTAGVGLLSLMLGVLIFVTLRTIPLRALRGAMHSLQRSNRARGRQAVRRAGGGRLPATVSGETLSVGRLTSAGLRTALQCPHHPVGIFCRIRSEMMPAQERPGTSVGESP